MRTQEQESRNRIWTREYNRNKSIARKSSSGSVWKGRAWEIFAASQLGATDMNADVMGRPFDILLEGVKIDVKCAELLAHESGRLGKVSWKFSLSKNQGKADLFLLICLLKGKKERVYLVPSDKLPRVGVSIYPSKSKYEPYRINL